MIPRTQTAFTVWLASRVALLISALAIIVCASIDCAATPHGDYGDSVIVDFDGDRLVVESSECKLV